LSAIDELVGELARLPGIGRKTALRLAFHLLKQPEDDARRLARSIVDVREKVRPCGRCGNLSEQDPCGICNSNRRDTSLVCVVEEASDIMAIERTGEYRGLYHVLGGALSPIDGIDPEDLKIAELVARVGDETVQEIVIATNPTTTGEATAHHIAERVRAERPGLSLTRLASGLPVGADLEHADEVTLGRAFSGRRAVV
jgi:recombination protein RecR